MVDAAWMAENMPDMHPEWRGDEEEEVGNAGRRGMRGLMYKGKWLISPERQERTVRLFWVSGAILFGRLVRDGMGGADANAFARIHAVKIMFCG